MKEFLLINDFDGMIVDLRDESAYDYGHIPSAVNMTVEELHTLDKNRRIVLYCRTGEKSRIAAEELSKLGYDVGYIKGGYSEWLKRKILSSDETTAQQAEESICKKFYKTLMRRFTKAVVTYDLIKEGDRIAVCISGGKDSMLMAKLFQQLKRHNKFEFGLEFLVMDPGYSPENREIIERNAALLNVPITVFETDIFQNVYNIDRSPCYVCARMRRGHLYNKARELGCNKIALGHHYDDVIETILMGMLFGGQVQTMMPRLKSTNYAGMELIRPMYLIREADVKAWRDYNGLQFIQCACRFTAENAHNLDKVSSKRLQVKQLIASLAASDPEIEQNIFKSVENVNLATVIAYKDRAGQRHYFADEIN